MKRPQIVFAMLICICAIYSCSSASRTTSTRYFGEGGSSPDTLYVRAQDRPVRFILQKNYRDGEGGSSPDTLYLKANEYARIFRLKDDKDKR